MKKIVTSLLFVFLFIPVFVNARTFTYFDLENNDYLLEPTDKLDFNNSPSWNQTVIYLDGGEKVFEHKLYYFRGVYSFPPVYKYYKYNRIECLDSDCYGANHYFDVISSTNVEKEGDIYISSINRVEKSEYTREKELPIINGLSAEFDIFFNKKNDYIIYDINVINDTDKDYHLINTLNFNKSEYLKYEIIDKNNDIVKSKSSKTVQLKISYINEIEKGIVNEDNHYNSIIGDKITNPITNNNLFIIIIFSIVILISLLAVRRKKVVSFLIVCIFMIPITIFALEKKELKLDTHVSIVKTDEFCYTGYMRCDTSNLTCYEFIVGETFREFQERTNTNMYMTTFFGYNEGDFFHDNNTSAMLDFEIQGKDSGYYGHCPN